MKTTLLNLILRYSLMLLAVASSNLLYGQATLIHSYTFDGSEVADGTGSANGTLEGGASIVNGSVVLEPDQYVSLDAKAIDINQYESVSFEISFTAGNGVNTGYNTLFYLGGNNVDADWMGIDYILYQPARADDVSRTAISTGNHNDPWATENGVNGDEIDDGGEYTVVVTVTPTHISYFLNNVLVGTSEITGDNALANVSDSLVWLGRSGYKNDPTWQGSIHEFNIYEGSLDVDGDGVLNAEDNCVDVANPNQGDDDADGIGNYCDADWASTDLSALATDVGELSPAFDPAVTEYTIYVQSDVTSVNLSATAEDPAATVSGDGPVDVSSGSTTATVTVTNDGNSLAYTVDIVVLTLKHGYTFEADAADVVGGVDGVLNGNAQIVDGALVTSEDGDYLSFDGAALDLSSYDAITMETYVIAGDGTNPSWTMLNYFGDDEGANAWFTSIARNDNISHTNYVGAGVSGPEYDDGKYHHIVSVLRPDSIIFYIDGEHLGSTARSGAIEIGTTHAYLAESGWPDATWNGSILEFNIYNGSMDAATVAERASLFDNDGDGIINSEDNCPDTANRNQADMDDDGVGNVCDDDFNAATLNDLTVDHGTLTPAFDPSWYEYEVYAPLGVTEVTLTATPEDPSFTVTGDGTLDISSGKATTTISVSGEGMTTIDYVVTVLGVKLEHAYTFDSDASDAAGDLDGQIQGAGVVENGSFVSASAGDGISWDGEALALSTYDAITLETFVVSSEANTGYHMLNYFGGANGDGAYWVQPAREGDNLARVEYAGSVVSADFEVVDNNYHHFVTTLTNDELTFYIDGVFIGSVDPANDIESINPTYAYLGLSGWPDNAWQGRVLEFNVYNGVMDAEAVASRANLHDSDGDGMVNDDDEDDDNDGQKDEYEIACGSDPLDAGSTSPDEDGDGIPDCMEADNDEDGVVNYEDNCPETANADQADMDNDGIGDVCDDDRDGDEIANEEDSCPDDVNEGDLDEDGVDDVCDELSATNSLVGDLVFGEVNVGSTATKTLNIVNQGKDALEVTSIVVPEGYSVDKTSATVAGESLTIVTVTFAPASEGEYNGQITVESNAGTSEIDVSGTAAGVLAVDPSDFNLKLGPNPVDGEIMIDWSDAAFKNPTIRVINIDGREIWKGQNLSGSAVSIDVTKLTKGLFFVQIQSGTDVHMFKMLKK